MLNALCCRNLTLICPVDYDQMQKVQDFELAELGCKVIKGELSNTLHKLRTNQLDSASMCTPARFGHFHQVLVRARKKCANLQRLMLLTGKSSSVYDGLNALLAESRQVFAELEQKADNARKRKEKKDDAKRFKLYIASILESDDPVSWMEGVSEAKLYREGGDVNRLYQLFIEGKGKYVLLVDSEMYREASLRDDIFSTKQCKELATRADEVAEQEDKEEEEARAAEEKRKLEEEQRVKMQQEALLREKWAMVGQNATIHGLSSEKGKTLNLQMARIMYYSVEKDRFEVKLYNSEEKAYLKKENLICYYGHVPEPKQPHQQQQSRVANPPAAKAVPPKSSPASAVWNCEKCTFENDDASTACSMCTNPKSKKAEKKRAESVAESKLESKKVLAPAKGAESEKKADKPPVPVAGVDSNAKLTKTIYVRSSHSKKLTGKRGRKKKDLINKSGVEDIQIETSPIGNHVPVHLTGSGNTVAEAIILIREAIGDENISEKMVINLAPPSPPSPKKQVAPSKKQVPKQVPKPAFPPAPAVVSPPASAKAPVAVAPVPSPAPTPMAAAPSSVEKNSEINIDTNLGNGMFSGFEKFEKPMTNGIHPVSTSESETQPTSRCSFGDALLPRGLMDMSQSSPSTIPAEVPSEIGINSQGISTRETITEASISSINDRSNDASKAYSSFTPNENDPLLMFLREQSQVSDLSRIYFSTNNFLIICDCYILKSLVHQGQC